MQALAAGKGVDVFQLQTACQLQPRQLLAVFKAHQLRGGAAGSDHDLQIGHAADETQIGQVLVVADVHVFDTLAVLHGAAGVVGDVVHRPEGVLVGEQVIPLVHAEVDSPDQVWPLPEVLPHLCQHLIVKAAVVQNHPLAAVENGQSFAQVIFPLIADGLVFVDNLLVGGADGFTKEGEIIVEGHVGGSVLQAGNGFHAQAAA